MIKYYKKEYVPHDMKLIRNCDYHASIGWHDFFVHLYGNDKILQTKKTSKEDECLLSKISEGWKCMKWVIEFDIC